ncbi:MAG: hypothetical protein P4L33_17765 [Capsulimonadaceae bacterium]|nr:hypothetical protein [Capsulimonadaceae bacterium]
MLKRCERRFFRPLIFLAVFLLANVPCLADPSPVTFPLVFAKDGMTVTVRDAFWMETKQGKGLLVHYQVAGDGTVPFAITAANLQCAFYGPNGENIGYNSFNATSAFSKLVAPTWPSARIVFHAVDPAAPREATEGWSEQRLQWSGVPVPTKRDSPVAIGSAQSTSHGTKVTLEKIMVRSASPKTKELVRTTLVFRVVSAPTIPDMRADLMPYVGLTTNTGTIISSRHDLAVPQASDTITGAPGYLSYELPVALDAKNAGSVNVDLDIHESALSIRDPRTFRDVTVEVPLAGLPGTQGGDNGPDRAIAVSRVGGIVASLEALTYDKYKQWHALIWLKSPLGGPVYELRQFDIRTAAGDSLAGFLAAWPIPGRNLWKANGDAPGPGEHPIDCIFSLKEGVPADAQSLTISVQAVAQSTRKRHFVFPNLPVVAKGASADAHATASEIRDASAPSADPKYAPATMTITWIKCVPNVWHTKPFPTEDVLKFYFQLDGAATQPLYRVATPRSITDDQGRGLDVRNTQTVSEGYGKFWCLGIPVPDSSVKTLSLDLDLVDTVHEADPLTFVFPNLPVSLFSSAAPQPPDASRD